MKVAKAETGKPETGWNITLSNPSDQVAFFVRLQIMDREEEIMPAFWSGNYLTLAPGESVKVHVSVPSRIMNNVNPEVKVTGWNVNEKRLSMQ